MSDTPSVRDAWAAAVAAVEAATPAARAAMRAKGQEMTVRMCDHVGLRVLAQKPGLLKIWLNDGAKWIALYPDVEAQARALNEAPE